MRNLKSFCLTLLISVSIFNSMVFAVESNPTLHYCSDGTFAHNHLIIQENESSYIFHLDGATILQLKMYDWNQIRTSIVIPKHKCHVSSDFKLFECIIDNVNLEIHSIPNNTKLPSVSLKYLSLNLSFVESASQEVFQLLTTQLVEGENEYIQSLTSFRGKRKLGCTN